MEKLTLPSVAIAASLLFIVGCKTSDVLDTANRAINTVNSTTNSKPIGRSSANTHNYVTEEENVRAHKPTRQKRDYGRIQLSTEKNPNGMTRVRVIGKHMDSGSFIDSNTYLYKISAEGWLSKKGITILSDRSKNINSGKYYLKGKSKNGDFYTVGEVAFVSGVTNIVTLDME